MQIVLQMTRSCNLACRYCYQRHVKGRGMSVETAEAALAYGIRAGHRRLALTFFGGEPLLEESTIREVWPRLRRSAAENDVDLSAKISTNGVLMTDDFAQFARDRGIFVSLSIDGDPIAQDAGRPTVDGAATSSAATRALEILVRTRTPFSTYSVVTPANSGRIDRSIAYLFEHGARMMVTTLDFGGAWDDAALDRLSRAYLRTAKLYLKWHRSGEDFYLAPFDSQIAARTRPNEFRYESCRAGVRQIAVDPDGRIYPCIEFLEDVAHSIGDVTTGIDHDRWRRLNAKLSGRSPEECGDCAIRERCASNCACLNLRTAGAMRNVDELLCAHERIVTLTTDRLAARLFKKRDRRFLDRHYNPYSDPLRVIESIFRETSS